MTRHYYYFIRTAKAAAAAEEGVYLRGKCIIIFTGREGEIKSRPWGWKRILIAKYMRAGMGWIS